MQKITRRNFQFKTHEVIKTGFIFLFLFLMFYIAPQNPIDPWGIFNPRKILRLIIALSFIQFLGSVLIRSFGMKIGAMISGLLGGLISSTALTASVARKSLHLSKNLTHIEGLTFLSSLIAASLESAMILAIGIDQFHFSILIPFLGPLLTTLIFIVLRSKKEIHINEEQVQVDLLKITPILTLSAFIIAVLALSKLLQIFFGQSGLFALTFIVSLFEIHGSLIANIQLHQANVINDSVLGTLIVISLASSYLSKLFLVYTLGSSYFKRKVTLWIVVSLGSLLLSWSIFIFIISI